MSAKPAKRATNISLSADVYDDAKALGLNISQTCDQLLREVIQAEKSRRWSADHAAFIEAYNRSVEEDGLPLESWRSF
ncbi:type II toxin-antitoxin system CcdA family antitoxin [Pigmentiphaga soli]|uniref:type II toxin-antitoxin system CcdA family antitoxin n=1 Tax=Pigmentiphaga soli TaxID=1007095 RepID=UPI003CD0908C